MTAGVVAHGDGYPDPGDFVRGSDGALYRVVRAGSRIETRRPGEDNICLGYELEAAEWSDLADEEELHESLAVISDA